MRLRSHWLSRVFSCATWLRPFGCALPQRGNGAHMKPEQGYSFDQKYVGVNGDDGPFWWRRRPERAARTAKARCGRRGPAGGPAAGFRWRSPWGREGFGCGRRPVGWSGEASSRASSSGSSVEPPPRPGACRPASAACSERLRATRPPPRRRRRGGPEIQRVQRVPEFLWFSWFLVDCWWFSDCFPTLSTLF